METIELHAKINYQPFDTSDYQWKKFTVTYPRGVTEWEQECLDTANGFFETLFSIEGFKEFFIRHECCITKKDVILFAQNAGHEISFPDSREFSQPFGWLWCQLEGGQFAPGHLMLGKGCLYDKLAVPSITVVIDGKEYCPFCDFVNCFPSCVDNNDFAWKLCEASSYNVPYLYSLITACDHNIEWLYEGSFYTEMDDGLYAVLQYCDEYMIPTYNVVVDEDSLVTKAGVYTMHILSVDDGHYLRELVRKHKKTIKEIIAAHI